VEHGCDALARLEVRLAEIERSLALIVAADASGPPAGATGSDNFAGTGRSTVETPRGMASLTARFANGQAVDIAIDTPSNTHLHLVDHIASGRELSDALLGIASLDLSPWELDR
jgi:Ni,Fe-hydrogenase III large subunit